MFKKLFSSFRPQPASAPAAAASPERPALAGEDVAKAEALLAAGNQAEDAGRLPEALERYAAAVAAAPSHPAAHLNLGIAQEALGDAERARAAYEEVLRLAPGHPFGAYNLGKLEYLQGRLTRAEDLLRQALAGRPEFPEAWVLLSNVLDACGKTQAAEEAIRQALGLRPSDAGAHYNHAAILRRLGRLDEAAAAAGRAAALAPEQPEYLALHATLLYKQGFAGEALAAVRQAARLAPHRLDLRSRELFLLNLVEGEDLASAYERHVRLGQELEAVVVPRVHAQPRPARSRLRIGLVSEDFCFHPVALFLLPWLEGRTRERFEVFCYSSTPQADDVTRRIQAASDKWVDARELHDLQLADAIAADGIDVLLDLGGHTGSVRLGVFAARPAPVQASWVGYLNTTGLSRIDFRITDARCDPPAASQRWHTERLLAMPASQWCYRPFLQLEAAAAPPCERNGFITFGSFNNAGKLTEAMAARWGRILQAVPGSRLLVAGVESVRKREALLQAMGEVRERVEFTPRVDLEAYYRLMDRVDIALDSYPYGGGTTTFDALWMGVPVLTATGEWPASRSAASLLAQLDLHDWIAPTIEDYEALAIARARHPEALGRPRPVLRKRLQASPLMDEPAFVAAFEGLLAQAWSGGAAAPAPAQAGAGGDARAESLIAQGNLLEDGGRPAQAVLLYREAAQLAPGLPKIHLNLGMGLAATGDLAAAVAAYRAGIALDAAHPFLHYNLAHALYLQGDFAGARDHARTAAAARPDFVQAHVLLSNALDELGDPAAALAAIERATALQPAAAGPQLNRVRLLLQLLRVDAAAEAARAALAAAPDDAELHWALAIACLLQGEFGAGWREHEWRPQALANQGLAEAARPRWDGTQALQGRSILLYAEQGFGDTLQFLRFVPLVAERARQVVLRVHPGVAQVARAAVPSNCQVVEEGAAVPPTDLQCPLLSVPLAMGVDEANLPRAVPYLRPDPTRTAAWRERLQSRGTGPVVGLAWSGNPAHANDRNRSMPLALLAGLAATGCRFVSLQPQVRETDRAALRAWDGLLDWGPELHDFADTAALMQALDLVVTVDTSVAHLAGALGRPTWILLPYVPDWRWMLQRQDSPWYPTARLYRQGPDRAWPAVVERVAHDLAGLAQKDRG